MDGCDRLIAHPNLEQWRELTRGINLQFVESGTVLQEDEIVLIPPVSGG